MSSQRSPQDDTSGAIIPAIILFGALALLLVGLLAARPTVTPTKTVTVTASPAVAEATQAPQTVATTYDPAKVNAGENSFQSTCSACHGFNAMGIPGLGKPLIGSTFVNGLTDDQLLAFLQKGRDVTDPLNTTGVMMPARGGNPNFTDDKLVEIIAYVRSLNAQASQAASGAKPTEAPTSSVPVATDVPGTFVLPDLSGLAVPTSISGGDNTVSGAESTVVPTASAVVPAESTVEATESAASAPIGETLYVQSCSGCHAVDGSGVQYIAKSLAESQLLQARNGIGLLDFLVDGDPTLNPPHPFRGGYPELSDQDLLSIIAYLYSLPTGK